MILSPVAALFGALGITFVGSTIILLLWWYVAKAWLRPLMTSDKHVDMMVEAEMSNFFLLTTRSVLSLPSLFINAFFSTFSLVIQNAFPFMCLVIICSIGLIWIDTHNSALESWIVVRQCYTQEAINFFLLPTIDIVVMLYNAVIGVFDFVINMRSAAEFVAPITLFKCALQQELGNLLFYIADSFFSFMFDLNHWVLRGASTGEWDVLTTLRAIGYAIDSLVPILDCFCAILSPVWEGISLFANEPSVHFFINCLLNTAVRLLQLIPVTLKYFLSYILPGFNPVKPDFTNATNTACCALYSAGDAIEDGVYLIVELIWGLLNMDLPPELRQLLSVHYGAILSHPLCGVVRVINMTAVLFVNLNDNPNGFLEPNGTGIQYLQFGFVADEVKYGAIKLGEPFYVLNPAAQAFVSQLALSVIDIAAFLAEWVIGNVWFAVWSNPEDVEPHYVAPSFSGILRYINFLFYYFPNYWEKAPPGEPPVTIGNYTYSTSLSQLYDDTFLFAVATGDLIGLFNNPLGCSVEHLLKSIITLITFLCNVISFFMPIFTFNHDPATSARALNTTASVFFLEARYTADCLGTLVSQFGNCTPTINDQQENLFCCTGHLITTGLDTIIILAQQIVDFFLDVLALPANAVELCLFGAYNPSRTECMRIPNLAIPIVELDSALCAFSCAVASIIPVTVIFSGFDCIFAPGEVASDTGGGDTGGITSLFSDFIGDETATGPSLAVSQCSAVQSCIGNVICAILLIFTVPFKILALFFTQMIMGNPIANLFDFLNTSAGLFARQTGKAADAIGILVDCAFCAFFNDGRDCSSFFYTLMHYVFVVPFVRVSVSFGFLSFYFTRIVMSGLKQIFDGAGYLGLYSIITKSTKLMGIYGEAANFWFTRVLSSMGLYMVGSTFSATNRGVCELVEGTVNAIAAVIATLTGGTVTIPSMIMCCYGSFACWPFKKRGSADEMSSFGHLSVNSSDGSATVTLTPDTWLRYVVSNLSHSLNWTEGDSCRVSMNMYKDMTWDSLTPDQEAHVYFCIYKILWRSRTDGQSMVGIPNSTCDDAMLGPSNEDWFALRPMEKSIVSNCIMSRIYIDDMRNKAHVHWFPQDWWTNEYRKMHFGAELLNAGRIYYQYMMDQSTAPSIMTTSAYQMAWYNMGLNISHYHGLVTTDDVLLMRTHYHLEDYYVWNNNATQYKPIVWFTTGIWSFIETITGRIAETSSAFSDNVTDPTVYLPYTYHTDVPGGVDDGLLFDLVSRIFSTINAFAKKWSNPANLKKRAALFTDAKKMTGQVLKSFSSEATRMSLEWWKAASHNVSLYYGEGEANETTEFMYEYESAIRGLDASHGNHSVLYKLSGWWRDFEMPKVRRVPIQLDGKYRGGNTHNNNSESFIDRLYRYTSLIRKGSDGANERVARLTSGFYMIRNRFYTKIIKQRIDEIQEKQALLTTFNVDKNHREGMYTTNYRIVTRPVPTLDTLNESHFYTQKLASLEKEDKGVRFRFSKPRFLFNRSYTTKALIRMNGLLDLVCTSSSAILCAECFFLDQILGRIENGVRITVGYYEGGQYGAALNETMDHFAYAFNESAPVRIGDSDELPVRWPWSMFSNWRILGDNTPNKLRFGDITNLTGGISEDFGLAIENSTFYNNIDYTSVDGIVLGLVLRLFLPIINFFYNLTLFLFSPTGVTDATASISFIIESWIICDWNIGSAFLGTHKRWSIGEALFGYILIYLLVLVVFNTVFGFNPWSLLASTGFATTIFIFTFLNVTYNWAWLCWPGLPVRLFLDINYFLIHTLFTKCEWFFSGLILNEYNNNNCYSCSYAMNVTMANCQDYGFRDIFSNIVFMMEYYAPWLIQWLRDTTTPLYIFYQMPFVNQRLNQFANVNMNDPDTFALYWACNAIITPLPRLFNAALFAIIIKFFTPFITIIISMIVILITVFISIFRLNYLVLESFFVMAQLYPFFMTGYTEVSIAGSENSDTMDNTDSYSFSGGYNNTNMTTNTAFSSPILQHQTIRRRRMPGMRPPEYNTQRNTLTMSSIYNTIDRTRMRYFGDHQD